MSIAYVVDKIRVFCTTLLECYAWSVSHTGCFISGEKAVKYITQESGCVESLPEGAA